MSSPKRQPALFLAHGDPMNALRDNDFTRSLGSLAAALPERPRAVLVVSAHWESEGSLACEAERPRTIHDFGGFPDELYKVEYPAPGAPELARKATSLIPGAASTGEWGLDHGAWSVLKHLFPKAEVPAFQVSIDAGASLQEHYQKGRALASLRDEGVLIVGSGNIVHNLRRIEWGGAPYEWTKSFDAWAKEALDRGDAAKLCDLDAAGEKGALACPTLEHYIPLLYALGAADEGERPSYPYEGFEHGSLSMRCAVWGI